MSKAGANRSRWGWSRAGARKHSPGWAQPVCGVRPWVPPPLGPTPAPPNASFHAGPGISGERLAPPPTQGGPQLLDRSAHPLIIGSGESRDPI